MAPQRRCQDGGTQAMTVPRPGEEASPMILGATAWEEYLHLQDREVARQCLSLEKYFVARWSHTSDHSTALARRSSHSLRLGIKGIV